MSKGALLVFPSRNFISSLTFRFLIHFKFIFVYVVRKCSSLNVLCVCGGVGGCVKSLQLWLLATLWSVAHQAPLSTRFSRHDDWSALSFPPPRDLHGPGTEPMSLMSPALAGRFFTTSASWKAVQFSQHHIGKSVLSPLYIPGSFVID